MTDQENEIIDESEVMSLRREKLEQLREGGFNFPNKFRRNDLAESIFKYLGCVIILTLTLKMLSVSEGFLCPPGVS